MTFIPAAAFLLVLAQAAAQTPVRAPEKAESAPAATVEETVRVQAQTVLGAGEGPIHGGSVLVREGRIEAVSSDSGATGGVRVLSCRDGGFLTPGLIDAAARAGLISPDAWAEQGSEVIPNLENLNAVDLDAPEFARLAEGGVTTVFLTPDPSSVIGCRGAIVKNGGDPAGRVIRERADVKVTLGPEGWLREARNQGPRGLVDYRARRPTTRMGMAWVFREAFYKALASKEGESAGRKAQSRTDPATETLIRVLEGEIPLRIQAREDIDIWSAIRLAREFHLPFVLEEGTQAYRCVGELKAHGVPVIYGPIFQEPLGERLRTREDLEPCLRTARLLLDAGIETALTAGGSTGEDALASQACYARRFGLTLAEALEAVTAAPARMLGIDDRVGSLAAGKDADLVLWTAEPFTPTAKPALVMIGGRVVYRDDDWIREGSLPAGSEEEQVEAENAVQG